MTTRGKKLTKVDLEVQLQEHARKANELRTRAENARFTADWYLFVRCGELDGFDVEIEGNRLDATADALGQACVTMDVLGAEQIQEDSFRRCKNRLEWLDGGGYEQRVSKLEAQAQILEANYGGTEGAVNYRALYQKTPYGAIQDELREIREELYLIERDPDYIREMIEAARRRGSASG